jgi:hypothetical protein
MFEKLGLLRLLGQTIDSIADKYGPNFFELGPLGLLLLSYQYY